MQPASSKRSKRRRARITAETPEPAIAAREQPQTVGDVSAPAESFLTVSSSRAIGVWLALTVLVAVVYAIPAVRRLTVGRPVVQDDARQHVFWMARFLDGGLFPGDPIADYFQSVAPAGYTVVYRAAATLGIDPLTFSLILPFPLALVTVVACFFLCLRLLPLPVAAFLSATLLGQNLWTKDDVVSATPRAFGYPILLVFLYAVARRSLPLTLLSVALLALFYPQLTFVAAAILALRLLRWRDGRPALTLERSEWLLSVAGLAAALVMLLPYVLLPNPFGPVISAQEARGLTEFQPRGRTQFFFPDPADFWLFGERSGLIPFEWVNAPLPPPQLPLALLLAVVVAWRAHFPLVGRASGALPLVPWLLVAGLATFFLAHALIFQLHVPARYGQFSLRIALALSAGIGLAVALHGAMRWAMARDDLERAIVRTVGLALAFLVVAYPYLLSNAGGVYPFVNYQYVADPGLYAFLSERPKDVLIASVDLEASNIPTFARRRVLVGREFAIPFHLGYYRPFRERTLDLIRAQYSGDLGDMQRLIQREGVDLLLLDRDAFVEEYVRRNAWVMQYEAETGALAALLGGRLPALRGLLDACRVYSGPRLLLLDAECVLRTGAPG